MKLGFFHHPKTNINLNFTNEISDGCLTPATIQDTTELYFMKVIINHLLVSLYSDGFLHENSPDFLFIIKIQSSAFSSNFKDAFT